MRTVLVLGGIWLLNFLRVWKAMPPVPLADTYSRVRVDAVAVTILQHQFNLCQMFITFILSQSCLSEAFIFSMLLPLGSR